MPQFQDVFISQIIGLLSYRQFTGDVDFAFDGERAQLRFAKGRLCGARYRDLDRAAALRVLLWRSSGELAFKLQSHEDADWDYAAELDEAIATRLPPLPQSCPLITQLHLQRGRLSPKTGSNYALPGLTLAQEIQRGATVASVQKVLPADQFWHVLLHLLSTGQVLGDYGPSLRALVLKAQNSVIKAVQSILGKGAVPGYTERLGKNLQTHWPGALQNETIDPVYGAAPYSIWAGALRKTLAEIGSTTLAITVFNHALASLDQEETLLLDQLIAQ